MRGEMPLAWRPSPLGLPNFFVKLQAGLANSLCFMPRVRFRFYFHIFSRFFISSSVPTTDEPDWSFFFTYFEWLFYTYTDERCYRVVFFFPFLDVLSLISVIIYLYIYIMFSKGAGKEVWLFSGNLLANTRATWGQGSFEKKLLWLFLIKVIKWTINGDCGKGRREIQKRMGGKLIS